MWLTDYVYIYVATIYVGYSDGCLYIHCLHESIYNIIQMDIVILLGLSQICFFFLPIIPFCNSEHFSLFILSRCASGISTPRHTWACAQVKFVSAWVNRIHAVKEQLEYLCTSMTQRKQLSLFNCSVCASVAAVKRTNTASGSCVKYSKIL